MVILKNNTSTKLSNHYLLVVDIFFLRAKINGLILKKQELRFYLLNTLKSKRLINSMFNLETHISIITINIILLTGLKLLINLELKKLLVLLILLKLT